MKKSIKTAGGILLALAGAAGVAYLIRRSYKKEVKAQEDAEQHIKEELDKVGISKENLDNTVLASQQNGDSCNVAFLKSIYSCLRYNKSVDLSVIDIDGCIHSKGNIIHVTTEEIGNKNYLNFLFEIPNYTEDSFKSPKIGDYISGIREAVGQISNDIIKAQKPRMMLEGYVTFSYDGCNGEDTGWASWTEKLDPSLYGKYADDRHDGLTKFYEELMADNPETIQELKNWIAEDTDIDIKDVERFFDEKGYFAFLGLKASFEIGDEHHYGVSLVTAVKSLTWLVNNLSISRNNSNKEIWYDHIMVHAPSIGDKIDLQYYFEEVDGEIITDFYL